MVDRELQRRVEEEQRPVPAGGPGSGDEGRTTEEQDRAAEGGPEQAGPAGPNQGSTDDTRRS
jgi:hypothetical protein